MHSAISKWPAIKRTLEKAELVYLFLDYDGTLTPIVEKPEYAILSQETKNLLQELIKVSHLKVAIISGRSLPDIKQLVSLKNIVYVGNHGYEIDGEDLRFTSLITPDLRTVFDKIRRAFEQQVKSVDGTWIEDKRATLSIHYRQLAERKVPAFKQSMRRILIPYLKEKEIKIAEGKKVIEVRPPFAWDKGQAVEWLLKQKPFVSPVKNILPIYVGDDKTDEDAFLMLRKKGITIFVGESARSSRAQYQLKDPSEVFHFLSLIRDYGKKESYADDR